ncbi:hypothetical protein ACFV9C_22530 [Kribbella sp. NPDC059898]|uniref:hypothetical protein n=1 Tax=Kribbella sp. NPDC059898 TaxID=3346995 RepID=UPI003658D0D6
MAETAYRVPEDSATYREFKRLYGLAQALRPTGFDQWKGELYATSGNGGFDSERGAIGINESILREGLSPDSPNRSRQAHALAAVLNRATHASLTPDRPDIANAVRTPHATSLAEGVAAVRVATDFDTFSELAGYEGATYDGQQHTGAYAAANGLIAQASGPKVDRHAVLSNLSRGSWSQQFDHLADAVVQNRLNDVVRNDPGARQQVRRELIQTMLHPQWDQLARRSPEAGRHVAENIGSALNAKVDEIRRRSPQTSQIAPSDGPQQVSAAKPRPQQESTARFLTGLAPAGGAARQAPSLGDGSRAAAQHATSATRPRAPGESMRR